MNLMKRFANALGLELGEKFKLDLPSSHGMSEVVCGKVYSFEETGLYYEVTNNYGERGSWEADNWILWALLVGEEESMLKITKLDVIKQ